MPLDKSEVTPVIGVTLRYLTKSFPDRAKFQYLGVNDSGQFVFSDSVHSIPVTLCQSYFSLFAENKVSPLTIVTVLMSSRERKAPFNVKFLNIKIESKYQVKVQLGNPKPY